jgi:hypothetical protein
MVSRARMTSELHPDVLSSIQTELAKKTPRRVIEALTGINRSTIDRIANGRHISQVRGSRHRRCPEGHLTILPCATCAALALRRQKRKHKAAA